jgi:tRNA modification GTPase
MREDGEDRFFQREDRMRNHLHGEEDLKTENGAESHMRGASHRYEEPIAALCSGGGNGAIGVIRVSGQDAWKLTQTMIRLVSASPIRPAVMRKCQILDTRTQEILDEAMVTFFKGPASYTGQDSLEIYCHGSPFVIKRILETLYLNGIRAAEPGEFTRRAFLNGKMDLTAAEGIKELIAAQSHQQWQAARYLMDGHLKNLVNELRDQLIAALAYLEASIDFPDEDDAQEKTGHVVIQAKVTAVRHKITALINSYNNGRIAADGMKVALVGEPNVGKSTLLNHLLGHERAIVTDIAGTTRDYIEESCLIQGRLIRLIDTAGIRRAEDKVEKLGIEATYNIIKAADLVVVLLEADKWRQQWEQTRNLIDEKALADVLYIVTKADLVSGQELHLPSGWLILSAKSGIGLEALRECLAAKVDQLLAPLKEASYVTSTRQMNALKSALKFIESFFDQSAQGQFEECLAFELQSAVRELASIIGEVDAEDILDRIFSEFCIGK